MISGLYHTIIYEPLYNSLVLLMDIIPWADAGVVVILLTIIVKLILFPLSLKAVRTQIQMKKIEPELKKIQEEYKKNKQEQAIQTMRLYKERGVRPFLSVLLIFIQIPIILALYQVFWRGGLPNINQDILYSFVKVPESVNMVFLGVIDIASKSIILALIVGVTAFIQTSIMMSRSKPNPTEKGTFKHDLVRSMNIQMKYVFPVIAIFISYSISVAISLYWITSNLFTIGQELYLKRRTDLQPKV